MRSPAYDAGLAEARQHEQAARTAAETDNEGNWRVLEPVEFSSAGGATLNKRDDSALVVVGANPPKDAFTINVTANLERITALRVEALPDDSLVNRGPGRAVNGNYVLTEVRV